MGENGVLLKPGKGLEEWLRGHDDSFFPKYSSDNGERSYKERYEEIKKALLPIHNKVEKGAIAAAACEFREKTLKIIQETIDSDERTHLIEQLVQSDSIVYLNNHGHGHVARVIDRVSEMLHFFDHGHLTPYEGFLLLCAIQVHDVGNIFGREEHEKRCKQILNSECKPFIPDAIERRVIGNLAMVHGGVIDGEPDTIGFLSSNKMLFDRILRKRLLAALLRFGDELADDSTRADRKGLEHGTILEGSLIYHHYSLALHSVNIVKNNENNKIQLKLSYEFESDIATKEFQKNGKNKYLLDEIYDRTLKMERERRYCMRFLRPYFSLDGIEVEIIIQHTEYSWKNDKIKYYLEENGYPSDPVIGRMKELMPNMRSGEEEMQYLMKEWYQS